ncbi:hypothetical protein ACRYI5_10770 [Furfurilactobacillus sp. WILCCON 0119]
MLIDTTKHEAMFMQALMTRETKRLSAAWHWNEQQQRWHLADAAQANAFKRERAAFEAQLCDQERDQAQQLMQRLAQQYRRAHNGEQPTIVLASDAVDADFGWVKHCSEADEAGCPNPLISEQPGQQAVRLRMTEMGQLAGQVQLAYYINGKWQTAKLYFVRPQVEQTMSKSALIDHCRRHERSQRVQFAPKLTIQPWQRVVQ